MNLTRKVYSKKLFLTSP